MTYSAEAMHNNTIQIFKTRYNSSLNICIYFPSLLEFRPEIIMMFFSSTYLTS